MNELMGRKPSTPGGREIRVEDVPECQAYQNENSTPIQVQRSRKTSCIQKRIACPFGEVYS